jgi:hypothetical protein
MEWLFYSLFTLSISIFSMNLVNLQSKSYFNLNLFANSSCRNSRLELDYSLKSTSKISLDRCLCFKAGANVRTIFILTRKK